MLVDGLHSATATMDQYGPALGFAGLIGFIVLIGVWASWMRGNIAAAIKSVADAHGFAFADNGLDRSVVGTKDGRAFRFEVAPQAGPNSVLMQRWRITLKSPPPNKVAATKKTWTSSASEGTSRVETGDDSFDKAVFYEADATPPALAWLNDSRKAALKELVAAGGLLFEGNVLYGKTGLETNGKKLLERFDLLWSVAQRLDG